MSTETPQRGRSFIELGDWLMICFILFFDFNGTSDLYDAIIKGLTK